MKTPWTLAALALAAVVTSGCCTQSWDWYEECDLIEGREARACDTGCDPCRPGQVVMRSLAVPAHPAGSPPAGPEPEHVAPATTPDATAAR